MSNFNVGIKIDLFEQRDKLRAENEALKERIKRLEEVAEDLVEQNDIYIRRQQWRKAKEAKP